MHIDNLVKAIAIAHDARVSMFIHGIQGLGKSVSVKRYTEENFHFDDNKIPYGYVDLRCASMESSEMRGLPDKDIESKRVVYYPPDELPYGEWINNRGETFGEVGSDKPDDTDDTKWVLHRGILTLEEVNRAEDDIHQAIFQLVYDFRIGKWKLPTGWSIVAIGNPTGGNFIVNHFMHEDAFKDRFVHITVSIDEEYMKSWAGYMASLDAEQHVIDNIINFCLTQPDSLSGEQEVDDVVITPSPRSWEMVAKIESSIRKCFPELGSNINDIRLEMLSGLVGQSSALSYIDNQVMITPSEIIESFNDNKSIISSMDRNQIQALTWGVTAYAGRINGWSESQMDNMIEFGKWVLLESSRVHEDNRDLAVGYFDSLLKHQNTKDTVRQLAFANKSIQRMVSKRAGLQSPLWSRINEDRHLREIIGKSHLGELKD